MNPHTHTHDNFGTTTCRVGSCVSPVTFLIITYSLNHGITMQTYIGYDGDREEGTEKDCDRYRFGYNVQLCWIVEESLDGVEILAERERTQDDAEVTAASTSEGERLIGESAKNQVALNPRNTVFDAKRLIGRKFSDPIVQRDIQHWSFKVVREDESRQSIDRGGGTG